MREVLNGFPKFLEVSLPENNVSSVFQLPKLTKNPPAYRRVYKISVYKKIPIRPQAVSSILKMRCVLSAPLLNIDNKAAVHPPFCPNPVSAQRKSRLS